MPKQSHSNNKNVSLKPILQDFSINSLSEISSGVLNPSDSTIYEEIKGYDVALPSVTLNNTEDINLSSGPYPHDSTMIDISKGTTPSQVFKKPFFNRQKVKPRHSLFDLDGEDFTQDTPEQKIHNPFKRKSKKTLSSTLFDLESSNENINNSNVISNFITRRTLRSKRNVDNSLFDKALETSESDISLSNKPVLRISKKNSKKVNASVFEDVFDDSLNLSNVGKSDSSTGNQQQCFNNVKNKQKHVDSAIFDSVFNSSASPEKSNNITLEKNEEESISVNISENSLEFENCGMSTNQTENNNVSCNSGITSEYECEENSNKLVNATNITFTEENTLNLDKSTDDEKKLEQIQQHEEIIGSKIADINNQNNSRCSVLVETTDAETSFANHELNENYNNKVTLDENQQMINTIGENKIPVVDAVEALAENKLDCSDTPRDLEESFGNFQNNMQTLKETQDLTNMSISHSFNDKVSVDTVNTSNLKANLHNISGNETQPKNITINEATPTNEESEMNMSYSDQSEKQHSAKEFSTYCEMEKDNTEVLYGTERDIKVRNSCGIIGTIGTQEITDKDNCMKIVSEESLLPIHETTVGNITITEIVQKESSFSAHERPDRVNSLEIILQDSLPSIHEATLTKAVIETNDIVQKESSLGTQKESSFSAQERPDRVNSLGIILQDSLPSIHEATLTKTDIETNDIVQKESSLGIDQKESSLGTQESTDRVKYFKNISEENIISTNNKETKTIQFQKEKRVSFKLDDNQLIKRVSLHKRKSGRKSILINNSRNSGKLSTSITKQTNMSKSVFSLDSLVFEEESENRASGSAFLDLHASKSATGSLNSNSAFSQQSKPSINASEQDHSYLNSRSSNNDYGSKDISGIESEQPSTMEKEVLLEDPSEMEDGFVDSSLIVENKLNESTAYGKVEEQIEEDSSYHEDEEGGNVEGSEGETSVKKIDEVVGRSLIEEHTSHCEEEDSSHDEDEEEQVEQENVEGSEGESLVEKEDEGSLIEEHTLESEEEDSSHDEDEEEPVEGENVEGPEGESVVENEEEDEGSLIEENTLESEEEEDQFNESMGEEQEPIQVENTSYREGEREEYHSEMKSLQVNLEVECITKKKNENPGYQTSNNLLKENKKKATDLQQLFKKPLPKKPINKRKVQEILENIPLSELKKKKKRRVSTQFHEKSNSSISREQMLQDEIEEALLKNKNTKHVGFTKANKLKIPRKWVTPKMYNFIISKLQPTFGLKARVRAENVVLFLVEHVDSVLKSENNYFDLVDEIKAELAGLEIVHSHWDFYTFATQFFDGTFVSKVFHSEMVNPFEPNDLTESIL